MEEKQKKKLAKVLAKLGLDEEKINEVYSVIDEEGEEEIVEEKEELVEEGEPTETEEPLAEEQEQAEQEPISEEPVELEVGEGEVEQPQIEETEPVVEEEKPAVEQEQPQEEILPPVDPTIELGGKVDEVNKVVEGLVARITSLEEELAKAGVLKCCEEKPAEEVGVDESSTETSKYANKSYDEILRRLNR